MRIEARAGIASRSTSPVSPRSPITPTRPISNFRFVPRTPNSFPLKSLSIHRPNPVISERPVSKIALKTTRPEYRPRPITKEQSLHKKTLIPENFRYNPKQVLISRLKESVKSHPGSRLLNPSNYKSKTIENSKRFRQQKVTEKLSRPKIESQAKKLTTIKFLEGLTVKRVPRKLVENIKPKIQKPTLRERRMPRSKQQPIMKLTDETAVTKILENPKQKVKQPVTERPQPFSIKTADQYKPSPKPTKQPGRRVETKPHTTERIGSNKREFEIIRQFRPNRTSNKSVDKKIVFVTQVLRDQTTKAEKQTPRSKNKTPKFENVKKTVSVEKSRSAAPEPKKNIAIKIDLKSAQKRQLIINEQLPETLSAKPEEAKPEISTVNTKNSSLQIVEKPIELPITQDKALSTDLKTKAKELEGLIALQSTELPLDEQEEIKPQEIRQSEDEEKLAEDISYFEKIQIRIWIRRSSFIEDLCPRLIDKLLHEQDDEVNKNRFIALMEALRQALESHDTVLGQQIISQIRDLNNPSFLSPIIKNYSDGSWNQTLREIAATTFTRDGGPEILKIIWQNSAIRHTQVIMTQEATNQEIRKVLVG